MYKVQTNFLVGRCESTSHSTLVTFCLCGVYNYYRGLCCLCVHGSVYFILFGQFIFLLMGIYQLEGRCIIVLYS